MAELILVENADGPVAEVVLNRPEKKNALTLEMLDELAKAGESLREHAELRAVILSGAGGDFSSGLDTSAFMAMAGNLDQIKREMLELPEGEIANRFQKPATVWASLSVPVIAAIEGVCFGAAAQIALGADFRFAAPGAHLSIMEGKWGLIPDMGISQSLPKLIPADRAKTLIMTAQVLGAEAARVEGLVTRVVGDPLAEARTFAEELIGRSPDALAAAKALVDGVWGGDAAVGLKLEAELQAGIIGGPNQVEAVMAAMQKRAPRFS